MSETLLSFFILRYSQDDVYVVEYQISYEIKKKIYSSSATSYTLCLHRQTNICSVCIAYKLHFPIEIFPISCKRTVSTEAIWYKILVEWAFFSLNFNVKQQQQKTDEEIQRKTDRKERTPRYLTSRQFVFYKNKSS